jgi:hypothetical protein
VVLSAWVHPWMITSVSMGIKTLLYASVDSHTPCSQASNGPTQQALLKIAWMLEVVLSNDGHMEGSGNRDCNCSKFS